MPNEPFHDGEIAVQERAGERDARAPARRRPSRRGSSLAPCRFWRGNASWRCLPPETTDTSGRRCGVASPASCEAQMVSA